MLNLTLTIDPSGSSTLNGPITLSFGGPFQTRGSGKLPESNFTVSASALGRSVSLGILSTGTERLRHAPGHELPDAAGDLPEARVELRAADLHAPARARAPGTLAKLGIHPLQWLTHPTVVGTETVGGAQTTHIHAGVNVPALLTDLNTFLAEGVLGQRVRHAQPQVRPAGEHPPEDRGRDPQPECGRVDRHGATRRSAG